MSCEYLGVRNEDGSLIIPPKGKKDCGYVFDVAPWDTPQEGKVRLRARSAGLKLTPRPGSWILRDKRNASSSEAKV